MLLRPILPQDVTSVARALLAVPAPLRPCHCAKVFDQAGQARAHVLRSGYLHPLWGDGSLDAAARCHPMRGEPFWDDPAYLDCLILVLNQLRGAARAGEPDCSQ